LNCRYIFILLFIGLLCQPVWLQAKQSPLPQDWLNDVTTSIKNEDTEVFIAKGKQKLREARDVKNEPLESQFLKELALVHIEKTKNLTLAMGYAVDALKIDETLSDKSHLLFSYITLAKIFSEVDDFDNIIEFTKKALLLNRSLDYEKLQIALNQSLGNAYLESAAYEKAQEQYENLLAFAKSSRHPKLEAINWFQLGQLEQLQQNHALATNAFINALEIYKRLNDKNMEASVLLELGKSNAQLGKYEKSLEQYKMALDRWRSLNNTVGLATIYNALASLFIENKEYRRAVQNLKYALNNAQKVQNQEILANTYDLLSKAYKGMNNYQLALQYKELHNALLDFIDKEKNDRDILKMQSRYTLSQQQSVIEQLKFNKIQGENELEEKTRFNKFLSILTGLVVVILVLIFFFFMLQRKNNKKLQMANEQIGIKNEELQQANATKDKFFSIIGHDLKGPLNSLTSFSSLLMNHADSLSKEEIQMLATDLDKSLKNLFALLENLLQWSRSQTGNIEFTKAPFDLTEVLQKNKSLLNQQAENKSITIELKQKTPVEVNAHEPSIDTVIRNLISNAIKFTHEHGKIKIGITADENYYYVKVADNGVGIPEKIAATIFEINTKNTTKGTAKEKGTGLGLILCKEFVEKNGGTISVKSKEEKGTLFTFSIPK